MNRLLNIIVKNFKILFRSKSSALTVLFGPLFIIFIIGIAFNNIPVLNVNVGHYSSMPNELTDSFVNMLNKTGYLVTDYESIEECRSDIQKGNEHICIEFPENFELSDGKINNIKFHVDDSKIHFFEAVIDSIGSDFNKRAMELSKGLTKNLVTTLGNTEQILSNTVSSLEKIQELAVAQSEAVKGVTEGINDIDLEFDSDAYGMDSLNGRISSLDNYFSRLNVATRNAIDEWEEVLADVEKEVNSSSTIPIQDEIEIMDHINSSKNRVDDIVSSHNKTLQTSKFLFTEIDKALKEIEEELSKTESKLSFSQKNKEDATKELNELSAMLAETRDNINEIQVAYSTIANSIRNIDVTDVDSIVQPINREIVHVANEESPLKYYFPYLIVLVIMFIGILLGSTLTVSEKKTKARFRNFITPTRDYTFALGIYLTTMIVILFEVLVIFLILYFYFKDFNIMITIYSILLIIFFTSTLFTLIGMIIGIVFSTEESATLASISFGSIFLFVSDLVFPLEKMPEYISVLAKQYNPFVVCSDLLRQLLVHSISIYSLKQLQILFAYIFVLFLVFIISYMLMRDDFISHIISSFNRRKFKNELVVKSNREVIDVYMNLKSKDGLETLEGDKLLKFEDIIKYVSELSDNNFEEMVNKDENRISYWIRTKLQNISFADELLKTQSQKNTLLILKRQRKEYEEMFQRVHKFDLKKQKELTKQIKCENKLREKKEKQLKKEEAFLNKKAEKDLSKKEKARKKEEKAKEKLEKKKSEQQKKKQDLENKKKISESQKKKSELEKKKLELEKKKLESEKKRSESEKKKLEAEQKKSEVEQQKLEAEKKKSELEKKKLEAEKKKSEAEKKKLESEKKKLESEKKKLESEKKELDIENLKFNINK